MKPTKLICLLPILIILTDTLIAQDLLKNGTEFPLFIIDTYENEIVNEPKIEAHLGIIHNEGALNFVSQEYNVYNGRIGIEIRGNGTIGFEKISYLFETQEENGENNNVPLLGFPKENDWVLYGPYIDRSLLRNVLTYDLARSMGYYASKVKFCELVINGEYLGVYVLMEKIKRDNNRIDVTKFDKNVSDPEKGGYLFKIDSWWSQNAGWQSETFFTNEDDERKWNYHYIYPDADEISDPQKHYIEEVVDSFEQGMEELKNTGDNSVYNLFDEINFADYFLINEFSKNPDAYRLSAYFHKDVDAKDGQIKLGPVWDYNFGFSNYWGRQNKYDEWEYDKDWWEFPHQIPTWWNVLLNDPYFLGIVKERWAVWRKSLIRCDEFSNQIANWHSIIEPAAKRNFSKWSILDTPNVFDWSPGDTFQDELDYLINFICLRIKWMDHELDYEDSTTFNEPRLDNYKVYPNPSNYDLYIQSDIGFPSISHTFKLFNLNGIQVYEQYLVPSPNQILLDFSLPDIAAGFYLVELSSNQYNFRTKVLIN